MNKFWYRTAGCCDGLHCQLIQFLDANVPVLSEHWLAGVQLQCKYAIQQSAILTVRKIHDKTSVEIMLNMSPPGADDDVIPGVEIDPQEQHSTCRVELSMAVLNLVQGLNEFAIKLDSARPPGESWVLISEIEMQVELKNST